MLPEIAEDTEFDPSVVAIALLGLPQTECKTAHYFGPGIYIREATIPADVYLVGHEHKHAGLSVAVKGEAIVCVDGLWSKISAPSIFYSGAGKKMLRTLSEFVIWNIHPNPDDETDMDVLRERYIDEPEWFKKYKSGELTLDQAQAEGLKFAPKALEN
jgi:hypothetical protein